MRGIGVGRLAARGRVAALGVAGIMLLVAGCTGSSSKDDDSGSGGPVKVEQAGEAQSQNGGTTASPTPTVPPATIALSARNGSSNLNPTTPVTVKASGGTLVAVRLVNSDGKAVKGALSADKTSWRTTEVLGYDKSYSVSAFAKNSAGQQSKAGARFRTVTPATFTLPDVFPSNGMTVGVGQPITVRFDEPIADKAAAEKTLKVTTSPQVQGSWHWFGDQVVHWRPPTYWKSGTRVTVTAKVYGVNVGNDIYGQQDVSSSFRIGQSKIATIDNRTKQMTVKFDGRVVRRIPVSLGKGGQTTTKDGKTIYFTTQSGPHIVAEKYQTKHMTSESYGLPEDDPQGYAEDIPLAVRISPDGEFVHAASWSVADQGVRNVSHGCVNISPANAQWFYPRFSYGDVVDIKNTGVSLPFAAGYNEWGVSWSQWTAGSALN